MLPNFMNKDIQSFIASLNYSLVSFGFLDLNFNSIFAGISLDYSQSSAYLRQINLNSGSGIANAQLNIFGICLCILVHVLVLIWIYAISKDNEDRWYSKWILALFERMTFGLYFTYITCSCLLITLVSLSEICKLNTNNTKRVASFSLSCIMLIFEAFFILFVWAKWNRAKNFENLQQMKFTKHLFEAKKDNNFARFNSVKYFIQRQLLWMIAVIWSSGSVYIKLGVFTAIQLCCFIYILAVRPFDNFKENAFEVINDGLYLVLIVLLFQLESEATWTKLFQMIYISIIFANNILIFIISFVCFFRDLVTRIGKGKSII